MDLLKVPVPFALVASSPGERTVRMTKDLDFDQFFADHFDDLVRSLTAITGDRELARDSVQEAFIKTYARWRRVRRLDNPVTWVRRVAINKSRDLHRSEIRRRRREQHTNTGVEQVLQPQDSTSSRLHLEHLLRQLTPRQRSVAALFYMEDLPVSEIGASLGLSNGAVKFHLNKARAGLKGLLESEEAFDA